LRQIMARAFVVLFVFSIAQPRTDAHSKKDESSGAGPQLIMIIRHGEKPEDSKEDKDPNLSPRGFERAAALAMVIPKDFPHPDFLFATKKSSHSNRPMETIEPLAKKLHEPIEATFSDEQYATLAHKLLTDPRYQGKVVMIAWHHGKIPELAHALGASEAPAKWNGKVFDRVWEITYTGGTATWTDLPQKALPGDSEQ